MDCKNILYDFFPKEKIFLSKKKRLIVLLGCFADFDSFEYCQQLVAQSKRLSNKSVEVILVGIGSEKSKERFCRFTKMDIQKVFAVKNADLHEKLNLNPGFVSPLPSIVNLLIMCAGINSKGTIREVLRGYLGDPNSNALFSSDQDVKIASINLFKGRMFDIFSKKKILRPFELATRRLLNMIEILSNWRTYFPYSKFLTERGGTFILDENNNVIYCYRPQALLGYSSNMSFPLWFLREFITGIK